MPNNDFKLYARLLERARRGDNEAFHEIYRHTWQGQQYHLSTILNKPEDVKDALQEVYLLFYQNMDKVNPPEVLVAYLNRLSYHVGKNMARKEYYRTSVSIDTDWMERVEEPEALEALNKAEHEEQVQAVRDALKDLPQQERTVVFMRYYQKLKHEEVALSLNISVAKAKRLQKSAQNRLKELLMKQGIMSWGVLIGEAFGIRQAAKITEPKNNPKTVQGTDTVRACLKSLPKSLLISSVAAAGITLSVAAAIAFPKKPSIEEISVTPDSVSATARVCFSISSDMPVASVTLVGKDGREINAQTDDGSFYTALIHKNDIYTINAQARNGKSAYEKTDVSCLDETAPSVETLQEEDGLLAVRFAEYDSGLDLETIYCKSADGSVTKPLRISEAEQKVYFPLPAEEQKLYVSDRAGNTGWIPVYCSAD